MKLIYIFTTFGLLYIFHFSIFFTKILSCLIFCEGFDFALLHFVLKWYRFPCTQTFKKGLQCQYFNLGNVASYWLFSHHGCLFISGQRKLVIDFLVIHYLSDNSTHAFKKKSHLEKSYSSVNIISITDF